MLKGEMGDDLDKKKKELKEKLMSRTKKRVFDKMFEGYSEVFKNHYRSLRRSQRTAIVNSGFVMGDDGRYQDQIMEHYQMAEEVKREKEREQAAGSSGVIQEVAEVHLGSKQCLVTLVLS